MFLWRKLACEYDQTRFTVLEVIKSTLPKSLVYNYCSQIKSNVGFWWEGKTRVPGEKPLVAEKRTNKLNPRMTLSVEIEPGAHWWKASSLTTRLALPPQSHFATHLETYSEMSWTSLQVPSQSPWDFVSWWNNNHGSSFVLSLILWYN